MEGKKKPAIGGGQAVNTNHDTKDANKPAGLGLTIKRPDGHEWPEGISPALPESITEN